MKSRPLSKTSSTFESIKRVTETGDAAWFARELARVLEYSDFRNFLNVIADARMACTQSGHPEDNHFVEFTDMVEIGFGARRPMAPNGGREDSPGLSEAMPRDPSHPNHMRPNGAREALNFSRNDHFEQFLDMVRNHPVNMPIAAFPQN